MDLTLAGGVSGFMGISICLLVMLKLMDVEAFAASFLKYDLTQRWHAWGRLHPGVALLRASVCCCNRSSSWRLG